METCLPTIPVHLGTVMVVPKTEDDWFGKAHSVFHAPPFHEHYATSPRLEIRDRTGVNCGLETGF